MIKVVIDRPLGSKHPKYGFRYDVNYGYIEGIIAPDNEEQDAYVLGVDVPLKEYEGEIIAIIKRKNDIEEKWVVANKDFSISEIQALTNFQEQYFDIEIIKIKGVIV